jgi:hypothetical protein
MRGVAEKHCLQVTDEHWQRAENSGSLTVSRIASPQPETEPSTETKKARKLRASDVPCLPVIGQGMTPTGIEPVLPP